MRSQRFGSQFTPSTPSPLSLDVSSKWRPQHDDKPRKKSKPTDDIERKTSSEFKSDHMPPVEVQDASKEQRDGNTTQERIDGKVTTESNGTANSEKVKVNEGTIKHTNDINNDITRDLRVSPSPSPEPETDRSPSPSLANSVPPEFLTILATFPLFKQAPTSFYTKVASKLTLMQYHPSDPIIKKGDPSKSMYWILRGTVGVTSTDGESSYAELVAGNFFGEIGILFNRPRTASVIARTKVLLGVLTSDALSQVLRSYPLIERRIRDEAQERLAMQDKKSKAEIPSIKGVHSQTRRLSPMIESPIPMSAVFASSLATAAIPVPGPALPPATHTSPLQFNTPAQDNVDSTISIQSFIMNIPIFSNLPPDIIHQLALGVEPVTFNSFEFIFHKGDEGSDIYFIVNGEIEVFDYVNNNTKIENILGRLGAGSYFGEMSFLHSLSNHEDKLLRSACIRSVTPVELIVIRSDLLENLCSRYPFIVDHMRQTANERNALNTTSTKLSLNMTTPIQSPRRLSLVQGEKTPALAIAAPRPPTPGMDFPFSSDWNFSFASQTGKHSRSISPVSADGPETAATSTSTFTKNDNSNGVTPVSRLSSETLTQDLRKRKSSPIEYAVPLTLPPPNPVLPSINSFQSMSNIGKNNFQYMPHNKRLRMASISNGRRRSSVLSNNGSLPDKILLKVFEFLPLPKLMKLRVISRRWRQLLHLSPNLVNTLDLRPWNTSIDDKALISITDFVGSRPTVIDLSNCFHVTDEGFSYMVNEIGMSGKLKVLRMKSNWEISAMAIMDLTVPSVGRYLEEIDLSNCRKVRDGVIERLIGWSNQSAVGEELRSLDDYTGDDIGCKNLKVLNVGYCKHVTDNVMYHIAENAAERLESLDLTRCTTITDKGFQSWTCKSFPNLRSLSLKDCTFLSDKSLIALANSATNLETLNLGFCCALTDLAVEVLCLGCPKLIDLDMSFCGSAVSDSSLVGISLHLKNLQRLVLRGCVRVTRAGVDALLSGCSPLSHIDITQCRNAHFYPGRIPAQKLNVNPETKSAFVTAGPFQNVIEILL
ncbi:hypothetical protein QA089_002101 [Meyerozyma guilliermondii]